MARGDRAARTADFLSARVSAFLVSVVSGPGAGAQFGAEPAWTIRRGVDRGGDCARLAGNQGLARADRARPDRVALVCRYLRIADWALCARARDHGSVRPSHLHTDRRSLARIARPFHFHFPLHRARRGTGLARICASAVAEELLALKRESHPRADLGAVALAADGKRIPLAGRAGVSDRLAGRHAHPNL